MCCCYRHLVLILPSKDSLMLHVDQMRCLIQKENEQIHQTNWTATTIGKLVEISKLHTSAYYLLAGTTNVAPVNSSRSTNAYKLLAIPHTRIQVFVSAHTYMQLYAKYCVVNFRKFSCILEVVRSIADHHTKIIQKMILLYFIWQLGLELIISSYRVERVRLVIFPQFSHIRSLLSGAWTSALRSYSKILSA